jgi:hypothetical protein
MTLVLLFNNSSGGGGGGGNISSISSVQLDDIQSVSGVAKANIARIVGISTIILFFIGLSLFLLFSGKGDNVFVDSQKGFSFSYPKDFETIIIERDNGTSKINLASESGDFVKVSIYPYEGDKTIKEKIYERFQDQTIENLREASVSDVPEALRFRRIDERSSIATREVWFTHKYHYLYRISVPIDLDQSVVEKIISTWEFVSEDV